MGMAPYTLTDVNRYGIEAKVETQAFYSYYKGKSVGNLTNYLHTGWLDREQSVPDLKDYYTSNVQWVGMYLDKTYFNRIEQLDSMFDLKLDLEGVKKSSRRLVNNSRLNNLLMVVPKDISTHVKEVYR
jgi:hypothetical protein